MGRENGVRKAGGERDRRQRRGVCNAGRDRGVASDGVEGDRGSRRGSAKGGRPTRSVERRRWRQYTMEDCRAASLEAVHDGGAASGGVLSKAGGPVHDYGAASGERRCVVEGCTRSRRGEGRFRKRYAIEERPTAASKAVCDRHAITTRLRSVQAIGECQAAAARKAYAFKARLRSDAGGTRSRSGERPRLLGCKRRQERLRLR